MKRQPSSQIKADMLLSDLYATFMQRFCIILQLQKTVMIISTDKFKNMNHLMNFCRTGW